MKKTVLLHLMLAAAGIIILCPGKGMSGTDAAAFLNNGIGARAMGMGGAYVSISEDPTAMYWNPAGTGQLKRIGVAAMGQSIGAGQWDTLSDIAPAYQFVGVTFPVKSFSIPGINNASNTLGVGVINSSLDGIPYTTVDGGTIVRDTFEDTETAYLFSYAVPIMEESDRLYAGVSLRYITQRFSKIADASATGYDMSAGALYSFGMTSLGLAVERGAVMTWANGHTDTSPVTTRLGVSHDFHPASALSLIGALDIVQKQDQPVQANAGIEFGYSKQWKAGVLSIDGIFVRTGVDGYTIENRYDYRDMMNNQINLNAGFGLNLSVMGYSMQLDYVFGSYRLGDLSRFSLSLYL